MSTTKGFIQRIRDTRTFKGICACLIINLLAELVQPTVSLALTEGPSQPEVQSFEPIGTTQMVDLFTGDFNYNIPLFNLPGPNGGYPVNIAYHAGASMDDEASWTGLGWNINAGSLVRNVRGLPDEFMSVINDKQEVNSTYDYYEVKSDIKENWTLGGSVSHSAEIFGAEVSTSNAMSIYYNNYNGMGASRSFSIGMTDSPLSIGGSVDTENGLGISFKVSVVNEVNLATKDQYSLTLNFDGQLSVDFSASRDKRGVSGFDSSEGGEQAVGDWQNRSAIGSKISFARSSFSPSIGTRVRGYSLNLGIKGGPEATGFFGSGSVSMFYNTQDINDKDKKGRKHPVIGYAMEGNLTSGDSPYYTKDFERSNDGQLTKSNKFLPYSTYTYDVYNSTGQGLSGYFRPRRSDVGRVHDPKLRNMNFGGNYAFEAGAGATLKLGTDFGASFGWSSQGAWDKNNDMQFDFKTPNTIGNVENLYYQAHGEMTILDAHELDYMNGLDLPFVRLKDKHHDDVGAGKRKIDQDADYSISNIPYKQARTPNKRVARNTMIHPLTNNEVANLGEFSIKYFTSKTAVQNSTPSLSLDRTTRNSVNIGRHPAGYKVLNEEGSYYVYGLPAYNNLEIENLFSVPMPANANQKDRVGYGLNGGEVDYKVAGSHKFIHKTTKSPYAHSYLLSSVQGADYVDLANDGPTDDDLGYWVKFNYLQHTSDYEWRAPYSDAQYHRGAVYTSDDDKASYQYGKKEVWYLGQIETKSHIAVFCMSDERQDLVESYGEHGATTPADRSMKLDEIKVYEKKAFLANPSSAVPLQTIKFTYDYSLCGNTPNSYATGGGKMTLKSIAFLSNGSTRGLQNKYEFAYGSTELENPDYKPNTYDSWGNYKPLGTNYEHHSRFPYTNQFNQDWDTDSWEPDYGSDLEDEASKALTKSTQDQLVSAWCLKEIKLPSGGKINIEYESDDYGYVQHKTACQMFKIEKLGDHTDADEIYESGNSNNDFYDESSFDDEKRRRIYFKLEEPIPVSQAANAPQIVYSRYVEPMIMDEAGNRNLYFKTKMRLTHEVYDYVSGYLPLEKSVTLNPGDHNYGTGTETATIDGVECYTRGYVTVQATKKLRGGYFDNYHPLALAGWVYLQTDAPKLLNNPNSLEAEETYGNAQDILNKVVDFLNVVPATASSFGAIRAYCKAKDMARYIDPQHSCIRLASPDKIKFGGGHRVKQISITDNWSSDVPEESSRTYGQQYEYTIQEGGRTISSGVAQYEPQAGGDENALKYPINYYDMQGYFTKNNLFAEAPLNENLFPGASVGYRQVSVKSLNTGRQMKNASTTGGDAPTGRTGGVTVHEFYTAKDFPTLVEVSKLQEENDSKDVFNVPIPIPLVGSIKRNYYHGTQAYKIELNDMHGKPKSVQSFELNNYILNPSPITSSIYEYQMVPYFYQNEQVFKLDNYVKVIRNDGTYEEDENAYLMGVECDLYTDQREAKTFHQDFGLEFNLDLPFPALPGVSVWPSFNNHKTLMRTYVMNKVIHRSGILKRTISRDLQTVNQSEIVAYDQVSGQPVLTKTKNEFGDDFYNYNIPAYYVYDRMGHAFQNINYDFETTISSIDDDLHRTVEFTTTQSEVDHLVRGDELLLTTDPAAIGVSGDQYKKGYFLGFKYVGGTVKGLLHVPAGLDVEDQDVKLRVIRSGRRNHYSSSAASYVSKGRITDAPLTDSVIKTNLDGSTVKVKKIANNVLSAAATLYKDDWFDGDLGFNNVFGKFDNPFLNGNSGIFRPYKAYSYVGKRKTQPSFTQNNTSSDPKLREDGVMSNVPMFTWDVGNLEDYNLNWEWVNEVTRYSSDAYELENVNRLGIYSSALYGYDNSLSIGVGGNANYYELATIDFETSQASWDHGKSVSSTGFNFYNNYVSKGDYVQNTVADIVDSKVNTDGTITAYIKNNGFTEATDREYQVTLNSTKTNASAGNIGFFFNAQYQLVSPTSTLYPGCRVVTLKPFLSAYTNSMMLLLANAQFTGKISSMLHKNTSANDASSSTTTFAGKAHTGKKSMKINGTVRYDQYKLRLQTDKKYILSLWVSRDNRNLSTFKPASGNLVQVGSSASGTYTASSNAVYTYGKIVEGWQKIDVEFCMPAAVAGEIFSIKFLPGSEGLYVDDIRLSPKTGGIMTYVYDPVKYWLRASLNADNYATLFFYDEEGHLSLKKQETEKGIFTISESRGHVSEN